MLKAGDADRETVVKGENGRREDDMMGISAGEHCVRTALCRGGNEGARCNIICRGCEISQGGAPVSFQNGPLGTII